MDKTATAAGNPAKTRDWDALTASMAWIHRDGAEVAQMARRAGLQPDQLSGLDLSSKRLVARFKTVHGIEFVSLAGRVPTSGGWLGRS